MEKLNELVEIKKSEKNELFIKDFEKVKETITANLAKEYPVFEIQNYEDYKTTKAKRAELNKIAKEINDNKINFINDLTLKLRDQTKAIVDLLKAKATEFDEKVKAYEGKEPKAKVIKQIVINCFSESEVESILARLPKKIDYKIKVVN